MKLNIICYLQRFVAMIICEMILTINQVCKIESHQMYILEHNLIIDKKHASNLSFKLHFLIRLFDFLQTSTKKLLISTHVFKQQNTCFHTLFHPHIFPHMFSNNKTRVFKHMYQKPPKDAFSSFYSNVVF